MNDSHGQPGTGDNSGSWDGGWDGPAAASEPADPSRQPMSAGVPSVPPPAPPASAPGGPGAAPIEPVFEIVPTAEPPARRRHPGVLAGVSAAAVVALVLAGAGVRQLVHLGSDTAAPAGFAPASTFAFAQVHLSPSAEQRVALFDFSRKFPGSPTRTGGASPDQVVSTLLQGVLKNTPVIYDVDIKPWLGNYAAVAGFTDRAGKPQALGIVAVKNKNSATTALTRVERAAHIAYAFDGGYALLAQNQAVLTDATAQLKQQSLGHSSVFSGDIATLPSGELVEGWANLAKVAAVERSMAKAVPHCAAGQSTTLSSSCLPAPLQGLLDQRLGGTTGRVVFGASVNAGYAEITLRGRDLPKQATQQPVGAAVAALPDDSSVALGIGSPAALLRDSAKRLDQLGSSNALAMLRPGLQLGQITQAIKEATGLTFPGDFETLLGSSVVASGRPGGGSGSMPLVALRSHPTDVTKAQQLAQQVVDRLGGGVSVTVEPAAGGDLVVASDRGYAEQVVHGGHLGDQQLFRTAVGPNAASAVDVVFVNLKAIDAKAPITAVGVTVRTEGADEVAQVRVVG